MKKAPGAVLVVERRSLRQIAATIVEPLTLALAVSLAVLGATLGWQARGFATHAATAPTAIPLALQRVHAPQEAVAYVDALCSGDTAYLNKNTGEGWGPMPWEPRLSQWALPCTRHRYLGALVDRLGRDQYVFTLVRPDGTEVLYTITFGRDGLVADVD